MSQIPYPLLTARYVDLTKKTSADRLAEAESMSADRLAREFNDAAKAFESFKTTQSFFPNNPQRDVGKTQKSKARTFGWAMKMKQCAEVEVEGDPDLNFRYVEREIIPTRTRPGRPFACSDGAHVRIDLILANARSKRPIIAELKIGSDKDPFTALVQALAGAAQLCSPVQRERLRERLPRGDHLARPAAEPLIDVYVLLGDFPPRGRHRSKQLQAAVRITERLESEALCEGIGRIRTLTIVDHGDAVSATTKLPN